MEEATHRKRKDIKPEMTSAEWIRANAHIQRKKNLEARITEAGGSADFSDL